MQLATPFSTCLTCRPAWLSIKPPLALNTRFLHDSGDFAELDTGATALAFCSHALLHAMGKSPRAPQADHPSFEIALVTDDVPAAVARARRWRAVGASADGHAMGQFIAYVSDLNGFLEAVHAGEPHRRRRERLRSADKPSWHCYPYCLCLSCLDFFRWTVVSQPNRHLWL